MDLLHRLSRGAAFVVVAGAVAAGWMLAWPSRPVAQPLAFNHVTHGDLTCAVCHAGAAATRRADLPSARVCLKCHATAPRVEGAAAVWARAERSGRIEWKRLTRVPDHVTFSHRRHVAIGRLECASCHGDVARRATPPAAAPIALTMDACLSCHKREGAADDCAACHR